MQYVTTMKDLIIKVHKVLIDNRDRISSIKTFKNGVLPPLPAFPAAAIWPTVEYYDYKYSGGKYKVKRDLNLQFITKTQDRIAGRDMLEDLLDGASRIIRDNQTFEDVCYDSMLSVQDLQDPVTRGRDIITFATMKLSCFSYEYLPIERSRSIDLYEAKGNHVLSQIYDIFKLHKNHKDYPLNALKRLNIQTLGPQAIFPSALISELGADRTRDFTGIDLLIRDIRIEVFTKLLDKDYALFSNLDIVENIKRLLQLDSTLSGAAMDSSINRIDYSRTSVDRLGLLYDSIIYFPCQTQEYLSEEEVMNEEDKKSW